MMSGLNSARAIGLAATFAIAIDFSKQRHVTARDRPIVLATSFGHGDKLPERQWSWVDSEDSGESEDEAFKADACRFFSRS